MLMQSSPLFGDRRSTATIPTPTGSRNAVHGACAVVFLSSASSQPNKVSTSDVGYVNVTLMVFNTVSGGKGRTALLGGVWGDGGGNV